MSSTNHAIRACLAWWSLSCCLAGTAPSLAARAEWRIPVADGDGLAPGWRPVEFPRVSERTVYRLAGGAEKGRWIEARSERAASALYHRLDLDPRRWPRLRWRWRVRRLPDGADIRLRSGDDYAARVYLTFAEDPSGLGWIERLQYESARLLYGEYPPLRAINYVWASRAPVGTRVPNAYTERAMMFVVDSGDARIGRWTVHERDLLDDYRRAFAAEPPRITGIAIMTDSDDTASSAAADYADLMFLGPGRE